VGKLDSDWRNLRIKLDPPLFTIKLDPPLFTDGPDQLPA
jgi:hypothetical protein